MLNTFNYNDFREDPAQLKGPQRAWDIFHGFGNVGIIAGDLFVDVQLMRNPRKFVLRRRVLDCPCRYLFEEMCDLVDIILGAGYLEFRVGFRMAAWNRHCEGVQAIADVVDAHNENCCAEHKDAVDFE